jgi:hypothetical protein
MSDTALFSLFMKKVRPVIFVVSMVVNWLIFGDLDARSDNPFRGGGVGVSQTTESEKPPAAVLMFRCANPDYYIYR